MKLLVEMEADGEKRLEVVEADSPSEAMNKTTYSFLHGTVIKELYYLGAYEVGEYNLFEDAAKRNDIHKFYMDKIKELGFDPITYEKLGDE